MIGGGGSHDGAETVAGLVDGRPFSGKPGVVAAGRAGWSVVVETPRKEGKNPADGDEEERAEHHRRLKLEGWLMRNETRGRHSAPLRSSFPRE
jgi:hypothetical protein